MPTVVGQVSGEQAGGEEGRRSRSGGSAHRTHIGPQEPRRRSRDRDRGRKSQSSGERHLDKGGTGSSLRRVWGYRKVVQPWRPDDRLIHSIHNIKDKERDMMKELEKFRGLKTLSQKVYEAFGPCTQVYECHSAKGLVEDFEEMLANDSSADVASWMETLLKIEDAIGTGSELREEVKQRLSEIAPRQLFHFLAGADRPAEKVQHLQFEGLNVTDAWLRLKLYGRNHLIAGDFKELPIMATDSAGAVIGTRTWGEWDVELLRDTYCEEASAKVTCWYCGDPAVAIWQTTWDEPGQNWPMCEECQGHVRRSLALRAANKQADADALDRDFGISTSGECGEWIDPIVYFARSDDTSNIIAVFTT